MDVQYRLAGELAAPWFSAQLMNLSANGLRFRGEEMLAPGTVLEIQMTLSGMREPLVIQCRVVWCQTQASGVMESGAEFRELSPDVQVRIDELVQFLNKGA
jgi:hypothetical protein